MRILALDWGTVRIGAAVSDPEGKFAFPLEKVIPNQGGLQEIKKIIQEMNVEKILIGLPKGLKNQDTASTAQAEEFITQIKTAIGIPVELVDERFSSVAASQSLSAQGLSQKEQRGIKDNIAAQIFLQQYLEKKL